MLSSILLNGVVACSKKEATTSPTVDTATYQGAAATVDEFGKSLADKSGIIVSVVGQSTYTTTTDASGHFTLQVPLGNQQLSLSKVGFGTYLTSATAVTSSGVTASNTITLGQTSTTTLTFWRWIERNNGTYYALSSYLSPISTRTQPRYQRFFFGRSADVSPTKYDVSLLFRDTLYDPNGITQDSVVHAPFAALTQQNVIKMYAVGYGDNPGADSYLDAATGLRVYPAISKIGSPMQPCDPLP